MNIIFFLILTFFLYPYQVHSQVKWKKTKINKSISVVLPKDFNPMSVEDLIQKYPSVRKPIGAYSNSERMVDFSVNISATQWREKDIEIAKEFFKSSTLELYDDIKFLKEKIKYINDKKLIVFEFESSIKGDTFLVGKTSPIKKYTYIQYLIINNKTIVFSLSCPARLKGKWQKKAEFIMNSIQVKQNI